MWNILGSIAVVVIVVGVFSCVIEWICLPLTLNHIEDKLSEATETLKRMNSNLSRVADSLSKMSEEGD